MTLATFRCQNGCSARLEHPGDEHQCRTEQPTRAELIAALREVGEYFEVNATFLPKVAAALATLEQQR
jgi:hypothetical protein